MRGRRKRDPVITSFPPFHGPLPTFEFARPDPKKMPRLADWERTPQCPKCGGHMYPEEYVGEDGLIHREWVCWIFHARRPELESL